MAPSGYVAIAARPSSDTEREDVAASEVQDSAPLLPSTMHQQISPNPSLHHPQPQSQPQQHQHNSLYSASSIHHSLSRQGQQQQEIDIPIKLPNPLTLTFNIPIILRLWLLTFAIIAFVLYIVEGGPKYIAAAVFLGIIILHTIFYLIFWLVGNVCGIFVEVRRERGERGMDGRYMELAARRDGNGKSTRVGWRGGLDLVLGVSLAICLIVGNCVTSNGRSYYYYNRYDWNEAQIAAAVFAYMVVFLQAIVATPLLDNTKAKIVLEKVKEGSILLMGRDVKIPVGVLETAMVGGTGAESANGGGSVNGQETGVTTRESLDAERDAQILELEREEGEIV